MTAKVWKAPWKAPATDGPVDATALHANGARYRALSDGELVAAMRRGEQEAFCEFVLRFQPLLSHRACQAGVPAGERDACVIETLGDAVTELAGRARRAPASLAAYLVAALRHRIANAGRDRTRRERWHHDATNAGDADGEMAIRTTCSEASLRASRGPESDEAPLTPALRGLAATLDAALSDEERMVLVWVSHRVPQREIARWLGVSHAATTKRLSRLRARLRGEAVRYAAAAAADERRELLRFFSRAASAECSPVLHVERAATTAPPAPLPSAPVSRGIDTPTRGEDDEP